MNNTKKPKISAEVSPEEFEAYKTESTRMGMNMSEWFRRTLNSALPRRQPAPAVAEAAFQQLEAQDKLDGGTMAPQPVVVATLNVPLQGMPTTPPPPPGETHPCVYLNPERPGVLRGGECSGTCNAQSQRGKPCFFGPVNARKCPLFVSRMVPSPPANSARLRR